MLSIDNEVCSLKAAKKLQTLGFTKKSLFYWINPLGKWNVTVINSELDKIYLEHCVEDTIFPMDKYPAYTIFELSTILPTMLNPVSGSGSPASLHILKLNDQWMVCYITQYSQPPRITIIKKTLVDAMAYMVIELAVKGFIDSKTLQENI